MQVNKKMIISFRKSPQEDGHLSVVNHKSVVGATRASTWKGSESSSINLKQTIGLMMVLFCAFKVVNLIVEASRSDSRSSSLREVYHPPLSGSLGDTVVTHGLTDGSMDPCRIEYWLSELSKGEGLLEELQADEIGVVHITFSINGTNDHRANDLKDGTHNRDNETNYSVSCLKTVLPEINYLNVNLGDFSSYHEGLIAQHSMLAKRPTFPGTFVIDTDVYANPQSNINLNTLSRSLKNVDFAFVYNPNRGRFKPDRAHFQAGGIQGGFIGQRNNVRTRLFNSCVADTLRKSPSIRQQNAINRVLESPVGQFVRVRWLPPEYHCWSPNLESLSDFVVSNGPRVSEDPCFFVHSHSLPMKGGLDGVC